MEQYDFREEMEKSGNVYAEVGSLKSKELIALQEAIQSIKEESRREEKENKEAWFRQAIIPIFKEFMEMIGGAMEVAKDEAEDFMITLKNKGGIEIGEEDARVRMALYFANYISMDADEEESTLTLTYNLSSMTN